MKHTSLLALAACVAMGHAAAAHGVAGARVFVTTLTLDDPAVADELSLPTVTYQRSGAEGGPGPVHETDVLWEFDKRVTEHFGFAINDGFVVQNTLHDKTRTGFQDVVVTAKYQAYVNAEHEALVSLGIIREFARTGTAHIGADQYGNTTPTIYAGKGLGDLPIAALRPFAVTGTFGYSVADKKLKGASAMDPDTGLTTLTYNTGYENRWVGGLSVQYSIPYLQQQVHDFGLPGFFARLTPLVEISWSSPASHPSSLPVQLVYAPGVIYSADTYQVGVEALIPGNRASGTNVGFIAQFHVFLDDLFPNSLGKPIFN